LKSEHGFWDKLPIYFVLSMSAATIHDLFEAIAENLGMKMEPYRIYRPRGVNVEGYFNFIFTGRSADAPSFSTHVDAITYYLQTYVHTQ